MSPWIHRLWSCVTVLQAGKGAARSGELLGDGLESLGNRGSVVHVDGKLGMGGACFAGLLGRYLCPLPKTVWHNDRGDHNESSLGASVVERWGLQGRIALSQPDRRKIEVKN